jgi:hypothetical protein
MIVGVLVAAAALSAAPISAEAGAREIWIAAPSVHGNAIWFPDELVPLAKAVADLLARPELGGYRVLGVEQTRALWADVQAGRLPGVPGVCAAPPPPASLTQIMHPSASSAGVSVDCTGAAGDATCGLDVVVYRPAPTAENPVGDEEAARFAARLPRDESPAQWAERLRSNGGGLRPVAMPPTTGGLGILSDGGAPGKQPRFRVQVRDVDLSGDWPEPLSAASVAKNGAALAACTRPGGPRWRDSWEQPYLIEVDTAGAIRRCEFAHIDRLPRPEFRCTCGVLRGVRLERRAARGRARFTLTVAGRQPRARDRMTRVAYLAEGQASDPSARLGTGAVDETALEACLGRVGSPIDDTSVPVKLSVAADGHVVRHETRWPRTVPAAARACLDGVLARASFNCPLSGSATIDAQLHVQVFPTGQR